ncbi:MAG: hypothetical protein KDC24_15000, partial [Saprospiraceae bacterium]|nr:hypothetical protein [Saprospiraceae bacterium]
MIYPLVSEKILALKHADDALRKKLLQQGTLHDGYHEEMEALHNAHAAALELIIKEIGFPTEEKVGPEAVEAAWLIAQHAIGKPVFMRYFANLMEKAVDKGAADPILLAYLQDRIAILEGRAQLYGTQFDWDENGEMSPQMVDEPMLVNQRRKKLGLNSLEEQTQKMRSSVQSEQQKPPKDLALRKSLMEKWRRKVGWN